MHVEHLLLLFDFLQSLQQSFVHTINKPITVDVRLNQYEVEPWAKDQDQDSWHTHLYHT